MTRRATRPKKMDLDQREETVYEAFKSWAKNNNLTIKGATIKLWQMVLLGEIKLR